MLEGVTVRFFPINGDEIHLTSRSGTFNLDTRDMTLTDSVVVRQQDRQLETDRLHYEKKRHIIYTNNNVILTAPGARLTAGSLTIDLNACVRPGWQEMSGGIFRWRNRITPVKTVLTREGIAPKGNMDIEH